MIVDKLRSAYARPGLQPDSTEPLSDRALSDEECPVGDLKREVNRFVAERDWEQFHSPKNLAMALMVETAELMEHFQWLTQEQSRRLSPPKKQEIEEEIGDILIYLVNLADKLDIDPVKAAKIKVEKNREKYPVSQSRGKSLKYNEYS